MLTVLETEGSEAFGSISWTPNAVGNIREVFLLKMNDKHRLQINIQGCAYPLKIKKKPISKSRLVLSKKSEVSSSRPVLGSLSTNISTDSVNTKLVKPSSVKPTSVPPKKRPISAASTNGSKVSKPSSLSKAHTKSIVSVSQSVSQSAIESQVKGFESWINHTLYPPQDLCDADIELSESSGDTHGLR